MNVLYYTYEAVFEKHSVTPRDNLVEAVMDGLDYWPSDNRFVGLLRRGHCSGGTVYSEDVTFIPKREIVDEARRLNEGGEKEG